MYDFEDVFLKSEISFTGIKARCPRTTFHFGGSEEESNLLHF